MTVSSNSCHRYSTTLKITIKGSSTTCSLISFLIWHFLCAIQAEHFGACCLWKIIYSVVIVTQLDVKPNPITVIFLQHTSKHTLLFFLRATSVTFLNTALMWILRSIHVDTLALGWLSIWVSRIRLSRWEMIKHENPSTHYTWQATPGSHRSEGVSETLICKWMRDWKWVHK